MNAPKVIVAATLLLLLPMAVGAADDTPPVVREVLESIRPNIEKARSEYGKRVRAENDKIVALLRKSLDQAMKAGKLEEALALKEALGKAEAGHYLEEMLDVDATDLLGDGGAGEGELTVFSSAGSGKGAWRSAGGVRFVKDPDLRNAEVAVLQDGCLFRDNYKAIQNGPLFISMWMKYEGGAGASIFGIAQERRDELSLIFAEEGRLGTYTGWPDAGMVNGGIEVVRGKWIYLACQWDRSGMSISIDGKAAGRIAVPALENRLGRLEIGVNSPGQDEYSRITVASVRIIPEAIVPAEMVNRLMAKDLRTISR